jgi:RNA polymerase sigma-70 factor (ECF subfamily)
LCGWRAAKIGIDHVELCRRAPNRGIVRESSDSCDAGSRARSLPMSTMSQPLPNLDLLLAQTDWVRALARRLVSDVDAADDVAQSTWLALLRRPLARSESVEALRAWLATTLRRNAARVSVERARRTERERTAARAERLPSTLDVLEQESVRRALVEAVLALDEPYRSALIMRYFEGLAPAAIASRLNVSGSTARTRLQRGLALLRDRFEHERGASWKSWCLLVVPFAKSGALGSGVAGGALVSSKLKLTALVALALCGSFVAWKAFEVATRSQAAARNDSIARLETPLANTAASRESAATRDEPAPAAAAPAPSTSQRKAVESPDAITNDRVGILVYGSIVDENGASPITRRGHNAGLVNMYVRFIDEHGDLLSANVSSTGAYSQAGLHTGKWRVSTWADGFQKQQSTDIELTASEPIRRLDLVARHAVLVRIKIIAPDGRPYLEALKETIDRGLSSGLIAVATNAPPGPRLVETLQRDHSIYEISSYWGYGSMHGQPPIAVDDNVGVIELQRGLPTYISLAWRDIVIDTQLAPIGTEEVVFTVPVEKVQACVGHARVRIVDAQTGEPIAASASLHDNQTGMANTPADKDGYVDFPNVDPGQLILAISSPEHEDVIERVHVEPGTLTDLGIYRLLPGVKVEGRVIDERGQPIEAAIATFATDEPFATRDWFRYSTRKSGEFRLPRMRHKRYWMWAETLDSQNTSVSRPLLVDAGGGDVRGIVFQLAKPSRVSVRLTTEVPWDSRIQLVDKDGAPVCGDSLNADGMKEFARLFALPGEYDVQLVSQDKIIRTRHVSVGDANIDIDF